MNNNKFNNNTNLPKEFDCLIIFGCHRKKILDRRINHLLQINQDIKVKNIVISGGVGLLGNFNESEYIQKKLDNKIKNIFLESKSRTTKENIDYSLSIIKSNNLISDGKLLLISDKWHLKRIKRYMKKKTSVMLFLEFPIKQTKTL